MKQAAEIRARCNKYRPVYRRIAEAMKQRCFQHCNRLQKRNPREFTILHLPDAYKVEVVAQLTNLKRKYPSSIGIDSPLRENYLISWYFADAAFGMIAVAETFLYKLFRGRDKKAFLNIERTEEGKDVVGGEVYENWLIDEHIKLLDPLPIFLDIDKSYCLGDSEKGQAQMTAYAYCRSYIHESYWRAIRRNAPDEPFHEALWLELMKEVVLLTKDGISPKIMRLLPHKPMNKIRGSRSKANRASRAPKSIEDYSIVIKTRRKSCPNLPAALAGAKIGKCSKRYWELRTIPKTCKEISEMCSVTEEAVKQGLRRNRPKVIAACPKTQNGFECCLNLEKD